MTAAQAPLVLTFSDALTGVASVRVLLNGADVTPAFVVGAAHARSTLARLPAALVRPGQSALRAVVRDRAVAP